MLQHSVYWAYFDEAWKKVIERFFPHLLQFFLPALYDDVDFSKGITFLDKEMEQLAIESLKGAKYTDKLVKVHLKSGDERWILVHIEVQDYSEEDFSERMFRYFYKIFDRYGKKIVSMSILTGGGMREIDGRYSLSAYGSGVEFNYLVFRIMDYKKEELEASDNPIAMVALAVQERERAKRRGKKLDAKRYLVKLLYERGYSKDEIVGLFEFIDWILQLSEEEEAILWEEIRKIEEVKRMPYITSVERIGMKESLLEVLDEQFGEVSSEITSAVKRIEDKDFLKFLLRRAVRCLSLEEFKQSLNGHENSH